MRRYALRDDQWDKIQHFLPGREGHVGGTAPDNRLFVDAVIYRYRAGIPWRDLPERYGEWKPTDLLPIFPPVQSRICSCSGLQRHSFVRPSARAILPSRSHVVEAVARRSGRGWPPFAATPALSRGPALTVPSPMAG